MNPPFERPWLSNVTLTLDAYRAEIEDAIMLFSVDYANYRCYGATMVTTAAAAAAQAATSACQLVPRNLALGGPLNTQISYDNQATIKTAGADIALNWAVQFSDLGWDLPGGLGLNLQASVLDEYRTRQSPAVFDVETEWKGSLGPNLSGTNPGAYDYRLFSSLSYFRDTWSVSLRWRSLPSVRTADYASEQALRKNNASVAAGGPGIILSYSPGTPGFGNAAQRGPEIETDAYTIFDASFNWDVGSNVSIRGGITNLFDTEPENVGSTTGYPIGTDRSAVCGGAPGCVQPTAFTLPTTGGFNGGYYDTLGRRVFLGVGVRF
jgi:outer membrane receptor protein involved in Fe transport